MMKFNSLSDVPYSQVTFIVNAEEMNALYFKNEIYLVVQKGFTDDRLVSTIVSEGDSVYYG